MSDAACNFEPKPPGLPDPPDPRAAFHPKLIGLRDLDTGEVVLFVPEHPPNVADEGSRSWERIWEPPVEEWPDRSGEPYDFLS